MALVSEIQVGVKEVLIGLTAMLVVKWVVTSRKNTKSPEGIPPPSPPGYPLIGNLPNMRRDMRETFRRLAKEFGGVFGLQVGPKLVVVISTVEAMKDAFVTHGDSFADRQMPPLLKHIVGTDGSFGFDNGPVWKARRRFGLTAMRNLGMGKRSMEHRIAEEARVLCDILKNNYQERAGQNPNSLITNAVANVICSISFGNRFDYDDPAFTELVSKMHEAVSDVSLFSIGNVIPALVHTPLYSNFKKVICSMQSMVKRVVDDHRETLNDHDIRDIIDLYLLEIRRQKKQEEAIVFDDARVWRAIFDLFAAGTGTTSTTLLWAILLMARYPNHMKRVQDEIERVVGDRSPAVSDQDSMPITMATILEVQRFRPVAPLGIPRFTNQDTKAQGYTIPKGTAVLMNIWELMHSPLYWEEPEVFNPSRFLSADGSKVVKPDAFLPFGIGNRMCMGELLARMELFLFFSHMFQRFTFRLSERSRDVPLAGRSGIALVPPDYEVFVEPRY